MTAVSRSVYVDTYHHRDAVGPSGEMKSMIRTLTEAQWQDVEALAKRHGLGDAELFALAVGCPNHGNAWMDFDDEGVFCHACEGAPWTGAL